MLQKSDLENILEFVYRIQDTRSDFRENVIANMKNCFGFNSLTFFLGEGESCLRNPITTKNIETSLDDYLEYYYQTDMFFFTHLARNLGDKMIITESDVMTREDFRESEYYMDFLKKYHLQQQITMQLIDNNKIMGAMGILKNDDEPPFTIEEIQLLDRISKHIISNLRNSLEYKRSEIRSDLLTKSMESQKQGILLFDSQSNIIYQNSSAKEYCYQIKNGSDSSFRTNMRQGVPHFILNKSIQESLYDFDYENFNFHLIPHLMKDEFETIKSIYSLYINQKPALELSTQTKSASKYIALLTQRECEIVQLIKKGHSNREISEIYFISPYTVKTHLQNIYKKLEVGNRTALIDKVYG